MKQATVLNGRWTAGHVKKLHAKGMGSRELSKRLGISREAVRRILARDEAFTVDIAWDRVHELSTELVTGIPVQHSNPDGHLFIEKRERKLHFIDS